MSNNLIARFNIHAQSKLSADQLTKLQEALYNAAIWASEDDPEVFFEEKSNVVGVSVIVEDDRLSLIEAGAVLGQCQLAYEKCGENFGPTWLSLHAADESVIDSPYTP